MKFFNKLLLISVLFTSTLIAQNEQDASKSMIMDMLLAIQKNDHATFTQNGSELFKEKITPEMLASVNSELDLTHYELEYFGTINRADFKQTCWKLTTADEKEWLLSFSLNKGVILGFIIN